MNAVNRKDQELMKLIFKKTGGRCHLCARKVKLTAKSGEYQRWQVDHILPKARRGLNDLANYLPICKPCNRLRWDLGAKEMKKTLRYGYIAFREVQKKTKLGEQLHLLYLANKSRNRNLRELRESRN